MQLVPITEMLHRAQEGGYGVGSFSARNTFLIDAVLRAAQAQRSPVIVQISANEFGWFDVTAKEFAERFYAVHKNYEGQAVLHLDHTKDPAVIKDAIDAGFMSVMIDASQKCFEENAAITKEVVEYAHARGVAVEAELGRIGATDKIETDNDESLYTDPQEAKEFVERTGVDTLAVSIGTAHGVYPVKNPMIDLERLAADRYPAGTARRQRSAAGDCVESHHRRGRRCEQDQYRHRPGAGLPGSPGLWAKDQQGDLADGSRGA